MKTQGQVAVQPGEQPAGIIAENCDEFKSLLPSETRYDDDDILYMPKKVNLTWF